MVGKEYSTSEQHVSLHALPYHTYPRLLKTYSWSKQLSDRVKLTLLNATPSYHRHIPRRQHWYDILATAGSGMLHEVSETIRPKTWALNRCQYALRCRHLGRANRAKCKQRGLGPSSINSSVVSRCRATVVVTQPRRAERLCVPLFSQVPS
jgi:hypothetical protein